MGKKSKTKPVCFILSLNTTMLMEHGEKRVKSWARCNYNTGEPAEVKAIKHYSGFWKRKKGNATLLKWVSEQWFTFQGEKNNNQVNGMKEWKELLKHVSYSVIVLTWDGMEHNSTRQNIYCKGTRHWQLNYKLASVNRIHPSLSAAVLFLNSSDF